MQPALQGVGKPSDLSLTANIQVNYDHRTITHDYPS